MVKAKSSKSWPTKQQRNRSVSADSWKWKWKAWLPRTNERIWKLVTADSVSDCSDRFATKIPIRVFGWDVHQHRHHHQNLLHGSQSYLIPWVSDQLCAQMFWVALKRKIAPLKVWRPWTCSTISHAKHRETAVPNQSRIILIDCGDWAGNTASKMPRNRRSFFPKKHRSSSWFHLHDMTRCLVLVFGIW